MNFIELRNHIIQYLNDGIPADVINALIEACREHADFELAIDNDKRASDWENEAQQIEQMIET